jgi:hypothetical protein
VIASDTFRFNAVPVSVTAARTTRSGYGALGRPVTVTANYMGGVFNPAAPDEDLVQITLYGPAAERPATAELRGGPAVTTP